MDGASVVAVVCLICGLGLVGTGVYVGLTKHVASAAAAGAQLDETRERLAAARAEVDRAAEEIDRLRVAMEGPAGLESSADVGAVVTDAASSAAASTDRAKSAIEQVGGIIGSLPEDLRFAGMLVLVGTVLVSVATIQFGGTSLF